MRRLVSAATLALAVGPLSILSPAASAATSARSSTVSATPGQFGVRLVDAPVSEADNPRALSDIIDYLPAGTVIHRRILVVNEEPRKARFSVYPDAAHISRGQFIGYQGATRSELTGWISVQHPSVTLPAQSSVTDMITIRVPKVATRGEHYGVIWVQQASRDRTGTGFGVREVSRVGIRVYLAVGRGGIPPTSFDIASITGYRTASGQPLVVAHVNNTGGRALDLNGTVRLAGGPGGTSSGPFRVRRMVTLAPGQSWNVSFAVPKSLPNGPWRATVTLVSGMTTATGTATVSFATVAAAQVGLSSAQWTWLGLIAFVVLIAAFMARYAWRHVRRQARA